MTGHSVQAGARSQSRQETVAINRDVPVVGQSKPNATTLTSLFTCPVNYTAEGRVWVANQTATATTIRLRLAPLGAGDAVAQYISYDEALAGNTSMHTELLQLAATDVVRCYTAAATVSFTFNGIKRPVA